MSSLSMDATMSRNKRGPGRPPKPRRDLGSVVAGEVLPRAEVARRLGVGAKTLRQAERNGLRVIVLGKSKFCLGADVLEFFKQLADRQGQQQARG